MRGRGKPVSLTYGDGVACVECRAVIAYVHTPPVDERAVVCPRCIGAAPDAPPDLRTALRHAAIVALTEATRYLERYAAARAQRRGGA